MLLCPHPTSTDTWMQQLGHFHQCMSQTDTTPAIQHCCLSTIEHHNCQSFWSFADTLCQQAACDQDHIGFFSFMVGRVASKWIDIQSSHYYEIGSPQSATLWLHCLCRQLIIFSHAMWLSRNQQVQELLCQQECHSLRAAICSQFRLGLMDLLLADHFYVTPGPQGFSLQQVLELPQDDQQLWLQAITNAREHGQPPSLFLKKVMRIFGISSVGSRFVTCCELLLPVEAIRPDGLVLYFPSLKFVIKPNLY